MLGSGKKDSPKTIQLCLEKIMNQKKALVDCSVDLQGNGEDWVILLLRIQKIHRPPYEN